jgi:uncharacterized iron-regulated membrane protein
MFCHTPSLSAKPQAESGGWFMRISFLVNRLFCLAMLLGTLSGCAMWDAVKPDPAQWNPKNFRDDRARDIDSRLSKDRPIVNNPFAMPEE